MYRHEDRQKKEKKPAGPKPWHTRSFRSQTLKAKKRKYWTRARWEKFNDARDVKREKKLRPYRMWLRLERQAEERRSEGCRQRMIALNEKRRAQKRALQKAQTAPGTSDNNPF